MGAVPFSIILPESLLPTLIRKNFENFLVEREVCFHRVSGVLNRGGLTTFLRPTWD